MARSRFSVLTYNVWHGLAAPGVFHFREFESSQRRALRWDGALHEIEQSSPDIVCLQELNPLQEKLIALARYLGGRTFGRVDQGGLRIFSRGIPFNLETGIGIVDRIQVGSAGAGRAKETGVGPFDLQLSGFPFFSGNEFSFHFREIRCALFFETQVSSLGRLLIVNVHLHHGFELFPELKVLLRGEVDRGGISSTEVERLSREFERARDRRLSEVNRLLEAISKISGRLDGVIIAGDLNSTVDGAAFKLLLAEGFTDLAAHSLEGDTGPTWDPVGNRENNDLQATFEYPISSEGNSAVREVFSRFDKIPRRVDFVMGRGSVVDRRPAKSRRIGMKPFGGFFPSDHYGVLIEWML